MTDFAKKAFEMVKALEEETRSCDRSKGIMEAKITMLQAILKGAIDDKEVEQARQEVLEATSAYLDAYIKSAKRFNKTMSDIRG